MPEIPLRTIVAHCDKILRTREIGDYDGAANGLQVDGREPITRIAVIQYRKLFGPVNSPCTKAKRPVGPDVVLRTEAISKTNPAFFREFKTALLLPLRIKISFLMFLRYSRSLAVASGEGGFSNNNGPGQSPKWQ